MEIRRAVAVIPARYASTRFPGKPLTSLLGRPMIAHVVERAREAGCFAEVLVATDDQRIAEAASAAGARPVMTGECRTGTDRVAIAARQAEAAVVINIQGDEPALPPANLRLLASYLLLNPQVEMATLALPGSIADLDNPNVVKLVRAENGRAVYFSRAPIPFQRSPNPALIHRHVGLYGFQKEALLRFASLPETAIERVEGLEQLRALHFGIPLHVLDAVDDSVAVDVPEDVGRAETALVRLQHSMAEANSRRDTK
jgi:3-deoxy-manno-octulosonate cytidylyltransferase (CMP-KDO synthetase)